MRRTNDAKWGKRWGNNEKQLRREGKGERKALGMRQVNSITREEMTMRRDKKHYCATNL